MKRATRRPDRASATTTAAERASLVPGLTLLAGLFLVAGCASGPSPEQARELLEAGDPEAALRAAREAEATARPADPAGRLSAQRVAFEAGLALGRPDLAARDLVAMSLPPRERERLAERLAARTFRAAFEGADAGRRAFAAADLALAAGHPALPVLLEAALADREPAVRRAAIPAVSALAEPEAGLTRLLRVLAEDDAPTVREAAALAVASRVGLPHLGEPATAVSARAAVLALRDLDLPEAPLAREALRLVGAPAASAARSEDLVGAAGRRARFLARTDPSRADLEAALGDGDPAVAPEAARLLAEKGLPARGALVRALEDGGSPARASAAHALGAVLAAEVAAGQPGESLAPLVRALASSDGAVRRAAGAALARAASPGGPAVRTLVSVTLEPITRAIAEPLGDADLAAAAALLASLGRERTTVTAAEETP